MGKLTHQVKGRPYVWAVLEWQHWGCYRGVRYCKLYANYDDAKAEADRIVEGYKRRYDSLSDGYKFRIVDMTIDGQEYKHNRTFEKQLTWVDHGLFEHRDICLVEKCIN